MGTVAVLPAVLPGLQTGVCSVLTIVSCFVQDFLDDTVESCSTRVANLSPIQLRDTLQAATGLITHMLPTQLDKWTKQARSPSARRVVDVTLPGFPHALQAHVTKDALGRGQTHRNACTRGCWQADEDTGRL